MQLSHCFSANSWATDSKETSSILSDFLQITAMVHTVKDAVPECQELRNVTFL